jgi:hypothetical protein
MNPLRQHSLKTCFLKGANHLGCYFIQVLPPKAWLQFPHAAQVVAMRVASAFYFDGMQKTFCKVAEQWNFLLRENSCTPLGEICLLYALNAVGNGFVSKVS